jgi:hypothetical protein
VGALGEPHFLALAVNGGLINAEDLRRLGDGAGPFQNPAEVQFLELRETSAPGCTPSSAPPLTASKSPGKSSALTLSPFARITARSMEFRNSRKFPGQE